MKCKDFIKNIIFYQEGEINSSVREQMDCHLLECENCKEELNISREITEILHNMDDIKKDEHFWNNLYRDIRNVKIGYKIAKENYPAEYAGLSFWDRFLKPALIGFSFGIILFFSYLYYDIKSEGPPYEMGMNYAVDETEFYIQEHSLSEDNLFSQGGLTPLLVSIEDTEK